MQWKGTMFKLFIIAVCALAGCAFVIDHIRVRRWRQQLSIGDRVMYHHEGEWKIGAVRAFYSDAIDVGERIPLQCRNELMPVVSPDLQ